jgi:hypothetical protein
VKGGVLNLNFSFHKLICFFLLGRFHFLKPGLFILGQEMMGNFVHLLMKIILSGLSMCMGIFSYLLKFSYVLLKGWRIIAYDFAIMLIDNI